MIKLTKKIITIVIIVCSLLCLSSICLLKTEAGIKILLKNVINKVLIKNELKNNLMIKKISGDIFNKLKIEDLSYTHGNYRLHISKVVIKFNWMRFLKKRQISVLIDNFNGHLNSQPITTYINVNIYIKNKEKKFELNAPNFIKIAENSFYLRSIPHSPNYSFALTLSQPEIINPKLSGWIIIKGLIRNDFNVINAKLITNKLEINKNNITKLLQEKNNTLYLEIIRQPNKETTIKLSLNFHKLNSITDLCPVLSRVKGKVDGSITLHLDQDYSKVSTDLMLNDLILDLPEYGFKLNSLFLHFNAHKENKIIITGKSAVNQNMGEIYLNGYLEPFSKNFDNLLEINTKDLKFSNNKGYELDGLVQLKIMFLIKEYAIKITGNTIISEGIINLDQIQNSKITRSNDISFIVSDQNKKSIVGKKEPDHLKILPEIYLRIEPKTKLIGKGLNSNISGKLKIYTCSPDNSIIFGDGRISIKHGTYTISNQKFSIEKGRIIYLPRTNIENPSLDIKILPNVEEKINKNSEKYLYIEGTLENPIIKDNGLIDEQQAVIQLLNFANDQITGKIKEKLDLKEFGILIENNNIAHQFKHHSTEESFWDNKSFIIGKQISDDLSFHYFMKVNPLNNTKDPLNSAIRLNYKLKDNWFIVIESSTEDIHGADLTFSIER